MTACEGDELQQSVWIVDEFSISNGWWNAARQSAQFKAIFQFRSFAKNLGH